MDDGWEGEYGSNFAIPGFRCWVRDMKVPWWVGDLRGSYLGRVPDKANPVKSTPEPVDPLGVGMNGREEFEDLVHLLLK